ncbi:MAG: Rieske (2Fe-2S) protein [Gemmataceae bacterium]|nr:Rieske (2Fe-2S) protein [Gemmataceae bacterium]
MTATTARVPLCQLDDIAPGLGRAFAVGGRELAVFRGRDGRVFAVDGKCPHKRGPLADGMLIGEQIVCPLHAFRFKGSTGACDQEGVCAVEAFPAEVQDGRVFVTVPAE